MVESIYAEYMQKSRIFVYPFLDIRKGSEAVPIESYISWTDKYSFDDYKLICIYHLRDDDVFKKFEKQKLTGNKLFDSYYETVDGQGAYVFDMSDHKSDWNHFINGTYTKLSTNAKNMILKFFMTNKRNYHVINSYLNPELYYESYAKLLDVNEKLLREVGELCSKPDLDKETLTAEIKSIPLFHHF